MGRPKGSKNKPKISNPELIPMTEDKSGSMGTLPDISKLQETAKKALGKVKDKDVGDKDVGKEEENKDQFQENLPEQPTDQPKATKKGKTKKTSEYPTCELCGKECMCDRNKVNLTYLTGKASYHRELAQDIWHLCPKCCMDLNNLIENWFLEHGAKKKFEYALESTPEQPIPQELEGLMKESGLF